MRDESHRFSRRLHHHLEKKKTLHSWLDLVEGIGPKTRKKLQSLNTFTPDELSQMSLQEIASNFKVEVEVAKKMKKVLGDLV